MADTVRIRFSTDCGHPLACQFRSLLLVDLVEINRPATLSTLRLDDRSMTPMPLPPEIVGDFPTWVAVALQMVQISQPFLLRRRERAEDLEDKIRSQSGMNDQEILERLDEDGVALELVEVAFDAGMRAEDEEKRHLLALVAARALLGMPGETADYKRTLMRTVAELQPVDVHLLACLRRDEQAADSPIRGENISGWLGDTVLVDPSLGALQRAGLLTPDVGFNGGMLYGTSRYGKRFLEFLLTDSHSAEYLKPPP